MFLDDSENNLIENETSSLKDEEVLYQSLKDPRLFELLVDRYQEAFIRKAKRVLVTQHDAEDAVQETFTKIYIYANKFQVQEGASFKSWAYKILINTCFTHGKKKKLNTERFSLIDPEFEHLIADKNDRFRSFTLKEYILSVLSRMPDSLSDVLEDYYIKGVSQKELAELVKDQKKSWDKEDAGGKCGRFEMSKLNIKMDGKEPWHNLSEEEQKEKIIQGAIYHHAYIQVKKRVGLVKGPDKIVVFTSAIGGIPCVPIGSTKASMAKFWTGVGVLREKGGGFSEVVLSPKQLEKIKEKDSETAEVNLFDMPSFKKIDVYKEK